MKTVVIVPTLNPKEKFIKTIEELVYHFENVIVINDGSVSECDNYFKKAERIGCKIIKHEVNKGKGAGIKSGIREVIKNYTDCDAVITVDADGQHLVKDVLKIKEKVESEKCLVLGIRDFKNKNVPFKSKWGNKISSIIFKLNTGITCTDTQTGLRAIPRDLFNLALETEGERFEYEMNFLRKCALKKEKIDYVSIETIYDSKKKHETTFRPFKDSMLIYKEQAKYATSSILSAMLDLTLFHLFSKLLEINLFGKIAFATIISRIISGVFNFLLNKLWTFKSDNKVTKEAIKYLALFILQAALSFSMVYVLSNYMLGNAPLLIIKIIVDIILFIASYIIQRKYIFKA